MRPGLLYLLGAALLLSSCSQTPVRDAPAGTFGSLHRSGGSADKPWFISFPTLIEYGLTVHEAPQQNTVGSKVLIVVSSSQELELSADVWRHGSTTSVGEMTRVEKADGIWRCHITFPETGEFLVTLSVRRPGAAKSSYHGVAQWLLHADVKPEEHATVRQAGSAPVSPARLQVNKAALTASMKAALEGNNIPAISAILRKCDSGDRGERAAAFAALKAAYFESDPRETPGIWHLLESAGMDPEVKDENDFPILFHSVLCNRIDAATRLLEQGAQVNKENGSGVTVLHILSDPMDNSVDSFTDWVRLFLRYRINLDARTREGDTALSYAAMNDRQYPLVVLLVEHGADFNIGNEEGNAPYSQAVQYGAKKNAAYLESVGARLYSYEFPVANDAAACTAILSGDIAAVGTIPDQDLGRLIARTSMNIPATPLHLAAEQGSVEVLKALCDRKADWNVPDRYGRSPLQLAVMADRADAVSLLMAHGADAGFNGTRLSTPFAVACSLHPQIAMRILAEGFVPSDGSAATAAVAGESLELVAALGDSVSWGRDSLSDAVSSGLEDITRYLSTRVRPAVENAEELIEKARKNRELFQDYEKNASKPLDAPVRSGGIVSGRGTFPYVVESWSPWLHPESVELEKYPVGVYVPHTYDGSRPFGLVVSMTNAKSPSPYPRDFTGTLDRHNLIWVGFDPYNGLSGMRDANAAFCLAIVYNMLGYFNIDQSRIYIGGYSLGGQMTEKVIRDYPWVFDGAFFININFSGSFQTSSAQNYCKHHMPVAIVEGDYDYNRISSYNSYDELLRRGYRAIDYSHEPMRGHKLISAASFERIINQLEAGRNNQIPGVNK